MKKHLILRRMLCGLLSFGLLASFIPSMPAAAAGETTNSYYVDSVNGSDNNDGTSPDTAWKTLTKINATTFDPGDHILFKCGDTWSGQCHPLGSGTAASRIVVSTYGTGARPVIKGEGTVLQTFLLENQEYWTIKGLEITNKGASAAGERIGLCVRGFNAAKTLHGIDISDVYVHDVNGTLDGTSGSDETSSLTRRCYATGGIVVGDMSYESGKQTPFDGISVTRCTVNNCSRLGILVWSDSINCGSTAWGFNPYTPNYNVNLSNNTVSEIGGDALLVFASEDVMMEKNLIDRSCTEITTPAIAMWVHTCKRVTMQYNEIKNTQMLFGNGDGKAFDFDISTSDSVMQYNYSHDNEGGFMIICQDNKNELSASNNIIRYNISENDGEAIFAITGSGKDNQFYNNTVYLGPTASEVNIIQLTKYIDANYPENTIFKNNIIYNLSKTAKYRVDGGSYTCTNNIYYGEHPATEPADTTKKTADPCLLNPGGTAKYITDAAALNLAAAGKAYSILSTSPAKDAGDTITGNGGIDYTGASLSGIADIGALEYSAAIPTVASIAKQTVNTPFGVAPMLPTSAVITYSDGKTATQQVKWDSYDAAKLETVGTFTVNGTVVSSTVRAACDVVVKSNTYIEATGSDEINLDGSVVEKDYSVKTENMAKKIGTDGKAAEGKLSVLWNNQNLVLGINATDKNGAPVDLSKQKLIISVSPENSQKASYDAKDFQFCIENGTVARSTAGGKSAAIDLSKITPTFDAAAGTAEISIDWRLLGIMPDGGVSFGLDALILDSSNAGISWSADKINTASTDTFGTVKLLEDNMLKDDITAYKSDIVLDGVPDEGENIYNTTCLSQWSDGDNQTLTSSFSTYYNDDYFVIGVRVNDPSGKITDFSDSCVTFYVAPENGRGMHFNDPVPDPQDANDYQIEIVGADTVNVYGPSSFDKTGTIVKSKYDTNGYTMEIAIPWSQALFTPTEGKKIGFDIQVFDGYDTTHSVDTWHGDGMNWYTAKSFGTLNFTAASEPTYATRFNVAPAGSTLVVRDVNSNVVNAEADGSYNLSVGKYTYEATAANYIKSTGSLYADKARTVDVRLAKYADYTKVDDAIASIPTDLSGYTKDSVNKLLAAKNAVVLNKLSDDQSAVDGYAKAIKDAINGLEKVADNGTVPGNVKNPHTGDDAAYFLPIILLTFGLLFLSVIYCKKIKITA